MNVQRFRFIERDYLHDKMKNSTTYITDEQINNYLNEIQTDDLTFIFLSKTTGFHSEVFCNITEQYTTLDSLNSFAFDFYLKKVKELSYEKAVCDKAQTNINKIKSMIIKWKEEERSNSLSIAQ